MLSAVVLVCFVGSPCTEASAVDRMRVPQSFATPIACMTGGQAYAASTTLVTAGTFAKVICERVRL